MNIPLVGRYFLAKERAYNRFTDAGKVLHKGKRCVQCERMFYTDLFACLNCPASGLPQDRAERCINFLDRFREIML